jgi:serine/threonine protein kinase
MLIGGRYEIIRPLGRGGFGKTFLAADTYRRGSPKCVVKKLQAQSSLPSLPEKVRMIFEAEAQTLYTLGSHPQIPTFYEHLQQGSEFYIVQELIDGNDLRQSFPLGDRWDEKNVISLLREILEILAFVQQHGVIHQDIAPHNFIRRWQDKKLVLIDFGGIKTIRYATLTPDGDLRFTQTIGTAGYTAPEQLAGQPDMASDIYSVGMMGIQAVTGLSPNQLPRKEETQELDWHDQAQVSAWLQTLLDHMVATDVHQRFQSALEVLDELPAAPNRVNVMELLPDDPSGELVAEPPSAPPPPPPKPKTYRLAIAPQFEYARDFSEGLAAVIHNGRLGFINGKGDFAIPAQFVFDPFYIMREGAYQFSEGLTQLAIADQWGYINTLGKFVIQPKFQGAETFAEGLARVEVNHHYGYINPTGEFAIAPQFESAAPHFSESLADVEIDQRHGYINPSGEVVIPPQFDSADSFGEGFARITLDHKYGFINRQGDLVIPAKFDVAHTFREGLARVRVDGKYGYINTDGELAIAPIFDDTFSFTKGLALVRNGDLYGFIDKTGHTVIPLRFEDAYPFSDGVAAVKLNGQWGYINPEGVFVIPPHFEDARAFSQSMAAVKQNGKWGYFIQE